MLALTIEFDPISQCHVNFFPRRNVERGVSILGRGMWTGSLLQEQQGNRLVVIVACHMQWSDSILALRIHIRLLLEQQLGNLDVSILGRQMEWRESLLGGGVQGGAVLDQHSGHLQKVTKKSHK